MPHLSHPGPPCLPAPQEDGYHMPDSYDEPEAQDKRYQAAMQRYKEPDEDGESQQQRYSSGSSTAVVAVQGT